MLPASGRPAARPAGARRADVPRPDPLTDPLKVARVAQVPADGAAQRTPARPVGRRIAPPEDRQPDVPVADSATDSVTQTGSHARILEPIADPPKPAVTKPAQPAPKPRRRSEPRVKPERQPVDRTAARAAARAERAATAAPAAKQAARQAPAPARTAAERRAQLRERVGATRTSSITENESWVLALLVGAATVALARLVSGLPELVDNLGGLLVASALAWGLAVRTGGRPIWATVLTAGLGLGAVITGWSALLSGAAIGTAVLAATLAVMVTMPAATFAIAIREVLIASAVAWLGALGVLGFGDHTELNVERFGYVVFALALVAAFSLVYRLGAGLHGLGRRGYAVAGGATLLLFVGMAYTEAISQWGSRDLVGSLDEVRDWMRTSFGAVAHPIMALLGYPALVWGVFMRARRRQGWWVCAFGVAATASSASRLIAEDLGVRSVVLGEVYSLVIGLTLGYLVIRLEQSFTGSHGRRARRDEEAEAHRPEPLRTRALH